MVIVSVKTGSKIVAQNKHTLCTAQFQCVDERGGVNEIVI